MDIIGQTFGPDNQYEIRRKLGDSLLGPTFLGRDHRSGELVVLKFIPAGPAHQGAVDRLRREAQLQQVLAHPHIVPIRGTEQDAGMVARVSRYVEGVDLAAHLSELARPLSPDEVLTLFEPLCSAIEHAHRHGVTHLSLRPSNVVIDSGTEGLAARITDFGAARVAGSGTFRDRLAGSPYLAPEQRDPTARPDERTDVYGLGVLLHECLTGAPPVLEGGRLELTALNSRPGADDADQADRLRRLDTVIARSLSFEPKDRFASVSELRLTLMRAGAKSPGAAAVAAETGKTPAESAADVAPGAQTPGDSHSEEPADAAVTSPATSDAEEGDSPSSAPDPIAPPPASPKKESLPSLQGWLAAVAKPTDSRPGPTGSPGPKASTDKPLEGPGLAAGERHGGAGDVELLEDIDIEVLGEIEETSLDDLLSEATSTAPPSAPRETVSGDAGRLPRVTPPPVPAVEPPQASLSPPQDGQTVPGPTPGPRRPGAPPERERPQALPPGPQPTPARPGSLVIEPSASPPRRWLPRVAALVGAVLLAGAVGFWLGDRRAKGTRGADEVAEDGPTGAPAPDTEPSALHSLPPPPNLTPPSTVGDDAAVDLTAEGAPIETPPSDGSAPAAAADELAPQPGETSPLAGVTTLATGLEGPGVTVGPVTDRIALSEGSGAPAAGVGLAEGTGSGLASSAVAPSTGPAPGARPLFSESLFQPGNQWLFRYRRQPSGEVRGDPLDLEYYVSRRIDELAPHEWGWRIVVTDEGGVAPPTTRALVVTASCLFGEVGAIPYFCLPGSLDALARDSVLGLSTPVLGFEEGGREVSFSPEIGWVRETAVDDEGRNESWTLEGAQLGEWSAGTQLGAVPTCDWLASDEGGMRIGGDTPELSWLEEQGLSGRIWRFDAVETPAEGEPLPAAPMAITAWRDEERSLFVFGAPPPEGPIEQEPAGTFEMPLVAVKVWRDATNDYGVLLLEDREAATVQLARRNRATGELSWEVLLPPSSRRDYRYNVYLLADLDGCYIQVRRRGDDETHVANFALDPDEVRRIGGSLGERPPP